jgi:single-strand DNA-binding protein
MQSLNRIQLIGHLGQHPALKVLPSGQHTATLKLATTDHFQDKSGNWQQQTEWHTLILWNKMADYAVANFRKGEKIYAEGKLKSRTYITPDQGKKTVVEIIVQHIFTVGKSTKEAYDEKLSKDMPW